MSLFGGIYDVNETDPAYDTIEQVVRQRASADRRRVGPRDRRLHLLQVDLRHRQLLVRHRAERAVHGPSINVTGSLSAFSSQPGTPSPEQSYAVSGTNLTDGILITAPADFQISDDER